MLPLEGACGKGATAVAPLSLPLSWLRDRPPQIDYVLFDLDDTLVDHRAAATTALIHAIERWSPDDTGPRPR